jgi:hypothetical protein
VTALPVIVVPDGLSRDPVSGRSLAEPSFVFRAVLEYTATHFRDCRILVAPANDFGAPASEQEVACSWLANRSCGDVTTVPHRDDGYIDTWGNAVLLRQWLAARGAWPLGACILVVAFLHARRAEVCFRRNGYDIADIRRVPYEVDDSCVPRRLFYYRMPWLHRCYEASALIRDRWRPVG